MSGMSVQRPGVALAPLSAEALSTPASGSSKTHAKNSSSSSGGGVANGANGAGLTPFGSGNGSGGVSGGPAQPSRPSGNAPAKTGRSSPSMDSPNNKQLAGAGGGALNLGGKGTPQKFGAKAKVAELYRFWLLLPETQDALKGIVDEALNESKPMGAKVVLSDEEDETPIEDGSCTPCVVVEQAIPTVLEDSVCTPPTHSLSPDRHAVTALHLSDGLSDERSNKVMLSPSSRPLRPHSPNGSPREHRPSPLVVTHVVDELDAAHRRGGLSPRVTDLSPSSAVSPEHTQRALSPMEFSLTPNANDFHPAPMTLHPTRSSGRLGVRDSMGSRRSSVSGRSSVASSRSSSPEQGPLHVSPHHLDSSPNHQTEAHPTPAFPVATLEDIPQFHFTKGKRITEGPIKVAATEIMPNAPPTLPPAVMAQQQQLMQQMAASGNTGGSVFANGMMNPPQPVVIPALTAQSDTEVEAFVTKNFAAIKSAPSTNAAGSAVMARRSMRSGSSKKLSSSTKGDAVHWQHINSTMHRVTTQCFGLPGYFSRLIISAILRKESGAETGTPPSPALAPSVAGKTLTPAQVMEFYNEHLRHVPIVRRMFNVLIASSKNPLAPASTPGSSTGKKEMRNYLVREDFSYALEVLLELHPGLAFLRSTTDFQTKYIETVILRIFYEIDIHDRGRISWTDFERSKLPEAMRQVDVMEDINCVLNFFSYEHFYVLYCRFWELDDDKDLLLTPKDLEKYAPEGSLNTGIIERVFKGYGRRLTSGQKMKMNYEDFVYFCLSEEDKSSPRSLRYWFRILDTDGDGILSGYELESTYNFTKQRMVMLTSDCIQFPDVMCQIKDMLPYENPEGLMLTDLLRYPQASSVAINMVTNVAKFLQFEQRDPFVAHQDRLAGGLEKTEWDRFARNEYDRMAMEAEGEQG